MLGTTGSPGPNFNGIGGNGLPSLITGASIIRAAGGGGGYSSDYTVPHGVGGSGGIGGGGGTGSSLAGAAGSLNTGSGGGGGGAANGDGGAGATGTIILRYSDAIILTNPGGGLTFTTDTTTVSGQAITTFTGAGTTGNIQFN